MQKLCCAHHTLILNGALSSKKCSIKIFFKINYIFCSKNFSIEVDMKSTIYCQAVENGDETEWDFGWQQYENSNVATEKRDLLGALSCTKEVWLLNRYIKK